eukprot:scaffold146_cov374-Prasinococcus_capsulatus_cf.AAC.14
MAPGPSCAAACGSSCTSTRWISIIAKTQQRAYPMKTCAPSLWRRWIVVRHRYYASARARLAHSDHLIVPLVQKLDMLPPIRSRKAPHCRCCVRTTSLYVPSTAAGQTPHLGGRACHAGA